MVLPTLAHLFARPRPATPGRRAVAWSQAVTLTTSDDLELGAWYLPAADGCRATVLVAPGNGGSRAYRAGLGRVLSELGFGVLLFDYRGYAANPGYPSEDGLARDVRAAREFLTGAAGVPAGSLALLRPVTQTRMPTALHSAIAAVDTPLASPCTRTVRPGCSRALLNSMRGFGCAKPQTRPVG